MLKGTYVRITYTLLLPSERASNLPVDTKKTPLKVWVKGFLTQDAEIGEEVEIITLTNRVVKGVLLGENVNYQVDYGEAVNELVTIGPYLKGELYES